MPDDANQSPPRIEVDEFAADLPLVEAVERHDAGWVAARLGQVGRLVGSAQFQEWAELANTHPPVLTTLDRYGNRIGGCPDPGPERSRSATGSARIRPSSGTGTALATAQASRDRSSVNGSPSTSTRALR